MSRWLSIGVGCVVAWVLSTQGEALGREANTTLRLPQVPERFGYTTEPAFGNLTFTDPVAVVTPPGETNRVFVVEQSGRISVITNLAAPTRSVFLDLSTRIVAGGEQGLLGLAFHPGYATNRQFYVFYTLNTTTAAGGGLHDRLSRLLADAANPNRADPASELPLLTQRDEAVNHNGGDLAFGPDGYLYVALGDEGGGNDTYGNSQRIDRDFFAGLLRLDVDRRAGSLPPNPHAANTNQVGISYYAVPADNPFVGATEFLGRPVDPARVRTEFWAVGLRNPWRISFDRETGRLYCADVGQDRWEEINLIERGGNYGWNYREGNAAGPRANPPANAVFQAPLLQYGHGNRTNQGYSVTGGVVYRGNRLAGLYGAYVFADYVSGHLWAMRYTGTPNPPLQWLATDTGIAGFGLDPRNGDVLLADRNQDTIKRLVYNDTPVGTPLPPSLADTGAFADLVTLRVHPGIVPYEINVPFWSDGAGKQRWFSVPDTNQVIRFDPAGHWQSPTGTVWVKHFELELTNGSPASARRLETRLLVRNGEGVYGVTYRWDDTQTNAWLVPEEGLDEALTVVDGGIIRTQVWRYPGRAECLACHTPQGGGALSFNTPQLQRDVLLEGRLTNQIQWLAGAGYLDRETVDVAELPRLAAASDPAFSTSHRVRSYLAANCAMCHQPSAGAVGFWDGRFSTPLSRAGLIEGALSDVGEDPANRVVTPGSIPLSQLLARISRRGPGQMPPVGSNELDREAITLLSGWITNSLTGYVPPARDFDEWQQANFDDPAGARARAGADPDEDGQANYVEYLVDRNPNRGTDRWELRLERDGALLRLRFARVQNHGQEFRLEMAAGLEGPWRDVPIERESPFFGLGEGAIEWPAPVAAEPVFYRVRLLGP